MRVGIFLGCLTRANKELLSSFENVFKKINISFKFILERECCGAPYLLSGMMEEFKKNAERVKNEIENEHIDTLVLNCPYCYTFMKKKYKEYGFDLKIDMIHITTFLRDIVNEGKLNVKKKFKERIVYHDPCYLGRQGEGIYEEPREILNKFCENIIEFNLTRETTTCCGGNTSMVTYLPHLYTEVSKEKITTQALPIGAEVIITSCPHCYFNFSNASKRLGNPVVVKHIVQILDELTMSEDENSK